MIFAVKDIFEVLTVLVLFENFVDRQDLVARDPTVEISNFFQACDLAVLVLFHGHHKIGCSIGIAKSDTFTEVNQLDEMIKCADDSLYNVKAKGKGTYIFA